MTELVPPDQIERIVGVNRYRAVHYGRAVSSSDTAYILHSQKCKDTGIDLRMCEYSLALDRGIDIAQWGNLKDTPVALDIKQGHLVPLANCPHCQHWSHAVQPVCNAYITSTIRDDVGFFAPPSGKEWTLIDRLCPCEHPVRIDRNTQCHCKIPIHPDMPNVLTDACGALWHEDDDGLHRARDGKGRSPGGRSHITT